MTFPLWLEWVGLFGTLLGTGMAFWAAISAQSANVQASLAREAAVRAARIIRLRDLLDDVADFDFLIAHSELPLLAAKAARLKGRIVRFENETYNELTERDRGRLALAREQISSIIELLGSSKAKIETKRRRIQLAMSMANEHLNGVLGQQDAAQMGTAP